MFEANSVTANAINTLLDQLNNEALSHRAPVTMPEGYVFENGAFAYIEPTPEIEAND
jgi:hypothetical protein